MPPAEREVGDLDFRATQHGSTFWLVFEGIAMNAAMNLPGWIRTWTGGKYAAVRANLAVMLKNARPSDLTLTPMHSEIMILKPSVNGLVELRS